MLSFNRQFGFTLLAIIIFSFSGCKPLPSLSMGNNLAQRGPNPQSSTTTSEQTNKQQTCLEIISAEEIQKVFKYDKPITVYDAMVVERGEKSTEDMCYIEWAYSDDHQRWYQNNQGFNSLGFITVRRGGYIDPRTSSWFYGVSPSVAAMEYKLREERLADIKQISYCEDPSNPAIKFFSNLGVGDSLSCTYPTLYKPETKTWNQFWTRPVADAVCRGDFSLEFIKGSSKAFIYSFEGIYRSGQKPSCDQAQQNLVELGKVVASNLVPPPMPE